MHSENVQILNYTSDNSWGKVNNLHSMRVFIEWFDSLWIDKQN